jgi:Cof subfamily protein (haloacid dehalogenase superfamily)
MSAPYKVIACDLDGTLLDAHHRLASFSIAMVRAVVARGVRFVIATGRHLQEVAAIRAELGVPGDLITCNGARVHDAANRLIYRQDVPADLVRELAHPAIARGAMINVYTEDEWLVDHLEPRPHGAVSTGVNARIVDPSQLASHDVAKLFYIAAPRVLEDIERDVQARFGDRISYAYSLEDCLEITAAGVTKGRALAAWLAAQGLTPADCIAFGDGMNDLQMLQLAGKALVMGNASPRVRAALPGIEAIGSHRDEAMAHYIQALYQL